MVDSTVSQIERRVNRLGDFAERAQFADRAAKFVGARAQLVEQPRVLDGDDRLGGEIRHQLDLFIGKWARLLGAPETIAPTSSFSFNIGTASKVRMRRDFDACNGNRFSL